MASEVDAEAASSFFRVLRMVCVWPKAAGMGLPLVSLHSLRKRACATEMLLIRLAIVFKFMTAVVPKGVAGLIAVGKKSSGLSTPHVSLSALTAASRCLRVLSDKTPAY